MGLDGGKRSESEGQLERDDGRNQRVQRKWLIGQGGGGGD